MVLRNLAIVEAVIRDSRGRILLLRRSENNRIFVGKWQLPGGKAELGEALEGAIKREILEETSCKCLNLKLEKVLPIFGKFNGAPGNFLLFVFSCKLKGKVLMSSEHSEFKYLKKGEINQKHLAPTSRKALFS
jgi:ADP-ribose pyrophosphatase YjhB (NUDIX family)